MFFLTELRRAPGTGPAPGTPEKQQHIWDARAEVRAGPLAPSERLGAATAALFLDEDRGPSLLEAAPIRTPKPSPGETPSQRGWQTGAGLHS